MALAFAFRNIRLAGMAVVSVGIIANLVPLVLNGRRPSGRRHSSRRAWSTPPTSTVTLSGPTS